MRSSENTQKWKSNFGEFIENSSLPAILSSTEDNPLGDNPLGKRSKGATERWVEERILHGR